MALFFPSLKQNFIAYRPSKVSSRPDCIFAIHQLWQSGFSRVYSNCCCSCSFEPEIIKIGQSSYKMYSNNILNVQESTTILNTCTKKVWKLIEGTTYEPSGLDETVQFMSQLQFEIKMNSENIIAVSLFSPLGLPYRNMDFPCYHNSLILS